ncbi:MAG: tannase/feruloyl esterase family alpha/beta hydrolase [Acidobacteria bacterium]|nr:tannase/feruloyl esterase family alpha/beta hydrolase [Acidobacteriota bacterium]
MRIHKSAQAAGISIVFLLASTASAEAANCEALAKLALPHTVITAAESMPAGSFTPPGGQAISNLPAFCRVAGAIQPSGDSDIQFEVWMPGSGWNGKFQGAGNGGFAGSIGFATMASALRHGYVTAGTDTGHHAQGTDGSWALGHPQKIVDFGYRAIHETAVNAKAITRAFYGKEPQRSYFSSCSNGGRQALMEAQRFPADYDGIIAGAPANFWTHLIAGSAWDAQAMAEPGGYFPPSKLPAIESAVLAACDALDGVRDGIINDPTRCHFAPSTLLCKGPESDNCLTQAQVATLEKIYAGPRTGAGEQVMPGYSPGAETGAGGWSPWITGQAPDKTAQYTYATQFFKNMVYDNPQWDLRTFQLDRDVKTADDKFGRILNATDPDLKAFQDRGGKLILYHGWGDAAIPPLNTIHYYQSAVSKMGADAAEQFLRLYMVPGMQHCSKGPGPDAFGQMGGAQGDARQDMEAALERWVEEGTAPNQIVATKYKNSANPASGVVRTRPLCPYPEVARWKGTGSTDDAANFVCAKPAPR